jgi:hypothetical protein
MEHEGTLKRSKEHGPNGFWAGYERFSERSKPYVPSLFERPVADFARYH